MAEARTAGRKRSGPRALIRRWRRWRKARRRVVMPTRTLVLILVYCLTSLALFAWIFLY
jgi:hypothetical protein